MSSLIKKVESDSVEKTQALAAGLAGFLGARDVLLLNANLGTGKTTFVQGLVKALGQTHAALSPTFIVAHTYETKIPVHHLDFYRLSKKEMLDIGLQDYFLGQGEIDPGIVVVEWADRCKELWPAEYLDISLKIQPHSTRRLITIKACGDRYKKMLQGLKIK